MNNENQTIGLIQRVKETMSKNALSQVEIAKKINVSESTLSQWLKNKYPGDIAALNDKINKFLDFREEKATNTAFEIKQIPFVETKAVKEIFKSLKMCQLDSEIAVVYGYSGIGKTTAINKYSEQNNGVIILEPDEECGVKALIQELYEKLGLPGQGIVAGQMKKEITAKLKDSDMLVIVDEGENLRPACFKALRKIHDKTKETFGLLYIGTEALYYNIQRMKTDADYFTSRIGYVFKIETLGEEDIKAIAKCVTTDEKNLQTFWEKSNGRARRLSKLIKHSSKMARMNNVDINTTIINKCKNYLID